MGTLPPTSVETLGTGGGRATPVYM